MTNKENLNIFYEKYKTNKRFVHSSFYKFQLKLHNIPYINKSYDAENRNSIPLDVKIPVLPKENKNKFVKKAIEFTENNFTARSILNETKINLYKFLVFYVIYCLNFLS